MIIYLDSFAARKRVEASLEADTKFSCGTVLEQDGRSDMSRAIRVAKTTTIQNLTPSRRLVLGALLRFNPGSSLTAKNYSVDFRFRALNNYVNFVIRVTAYNRDYFKLRMYTGPTEGTYEAISDGDNLYVGTDDWHFFEFFCDMTNASAKLGRAKVAVDGITVYDRDNIYTADYLPWSGNSNHERAFNNSIQIYISGTPSGWLGLDIADLRVGNEGMGYLTDFMGVTQVSCATPIAAGDFTNWQGYANSEPTDVESHLLVGQPDVDISGSETSYVEGTLDGIRDLFLYDFLSWPVTTQVYAVAHKILARRIAVSGTPPPDNIAPLSRPSGYPIEFHDENITKISGYAYSYVDIYFSIVPQLAVAWTLDYLRNAQFGYELVEQAFTPKILEDIQAVDDTAEQLLLPELVEGGIDFVDDSFDGYETIEEEFGVEESVVDGDTA